MRRRGSRRGGERTKRSWGTKSKPARRVGAGGAGGRGVSLLYVRARHGVLKPFLKKGHHAIGSINSPMQCMMKEICAQCLQQHRDPVTGEETVVFSCFNQDQPLDQG